MSSCSCEASFSKACSDIIAAVDAANLDLPPSIKISIENVDKAGEHETTDLMKSILARRVSAIVSVTKAEDEKYALGIVLEPLKEMGKTDSQNDLYSADEVKKAAYLFMEEFANMGVQHTELANSKIKILETWIQREDATIEGTAVTKGTWMMAVRFLDDELWTKVKKGEITGFSIGGIASRTPVE